MCVYVDHVRIPYGRMRMSHMLADTLGELHAMAAQLGLKREWFQQDASTPHYDVCEAKRELAIQLGAKPIGRREVVALIRRYRSSHG